MRRLRALYETFKHNPQWADTVDQRSAVDIAGKVEHLFDACTRSLDRSLELWDAAQRMSTRDGRTRMLEKREKLLQEVAASVEQFATTIDSVQALTLEQQSSAAELVGLREELDQSLNVARRVEERMRNLESELGAERLQE